jgi:flagellar capping protein FliD
MSSVMESYGRGLTLTNARTYTTAAGNAIGGGASPIAWSQLGLTMARDGTVSFDASALSNTLSGGLGAAIREGFDASLTSVLGTFRGVGGSVQTTIDNIQLSLTNLQSRKSELESRVERTRQSLVKKYAALDAKLTQMNQMSANVRSALAGLAR